MDLCDVTAIFKASVEEELQGEEKLLGVPSADDETHR